jgi:hypothetical protein
MVREQQPGKPASNKPDQKALSFKGRSPRGRPFRASSKNPMHILCWRDGKGMELAEGQVYTDQAYPEQHFFIERDTGRFEVRLPRNHFNRSPVQRDAETQLGKECFWKSAPKVTVKLPKMRPRPILE